MGRGTRWDKLRSPKGRAPSYVTLGFVFWEVKFDHPKVHGRATRMGWALRRGWVTERIWATQKGWAAEAGWATVRRWAHAPAGL